MKVLTSVTHVESHSVAQQNGSGIWPTLTGSTHTQFWIVALEQPGVACAVQQVPTFATGGPHFPLVQVPLQHCAFIEQTWPSGLQGIPPQVPPTQLALQHWALLAQA